MTGPRGAPLRPVPTLTEVVEAAAPGGATDAAPEPVGAAVSQEQVAQTVLGNLQGQIDLMLEPRLREILAPALARLSDALVHDLRGDLAAALRDIVDRAVAQELLRQRGRETQR